MRQKVRRGFRAHSSNGVDKNGTKCNMGIGHITENDGQKNAKCNMVFDSDTFSKKMQQLKN